MGDTTVNYSTIPKFSPLRSIIALMLREMGSTYGQSPGGYIWAILQPIGLILILSIGFSLLIRSPSLGTSFLLFYATGYLAYDIYNQLMRKIITALKYSKAMLTYPRVIWLDAILARFFLNSLTLLTVFCIVITAILIFVNTRTVLSVEPILLGLCISLIFGLGIGMVNCLLIGLFPVWDVIWKILTRPMFIASGVLFIFEDMPPAAQSILWWNPMMHATGLIRTGFYPNYHASYVSLVYCFGISLLLITAGLVFLRAYHENILQR